MAGNPLQPVGGQKQGAAQGGRRALTGPGRRPSDPVLTLLLGTGWLLVPPTPVSCFPPWLVRSCEGVHTSPILLVMASQTDTPGDM